jgi:hypothetical protein
LSSSDTAELGSRKIIDDPGCGHRMTVTMINVRTKPKTCSNKPHYAWNFRKSKWHNYKEELD